MDRRGSIQGNVASVLVGRGSGLLTLSPDIHNSVFGNWKQEVSLSVGARW